MSTARRMGRYRRQQIENKRLNAWVVDICAEITKKIESEMKEHNHYQTDERRRELARLIINELGGYYGSESTKPVFIKPECIVGECQPKSQGFFRRLFGC